MNKQYSISDIIENTKLIEELDNSDTLLHILNVVSQLLVESDNTQSKAATFTQEYKLGHRKLFIKFY